MTWISTGQLATARRVLRRTVAALAPYLRRGVKVVGPERVLLPAVRDATADSFVLADGFSCRTQIEQAGTGRTPVHLAEILAAGRHVAGSGAAVAALLAGRPKRG